MSTKPPVPDQVNHEYQSPVPVFEGTDQSQSAPCIASSSEIRPAITSSSAPITAAATAPPMTAAELIGGNSPRGEPGYRERRSAPSAACVRIFSAEIAV